MAMRSPLLLGHRGARASRTIQENTLASFDLALEHGCDGFEFDVRLTGNGQAVICHNARSRGRLLLKNEAADFQHLPALTDVIARFCTRAARQADGSHAAFCAPAFRCPEKWSS